MDQEVLKGLLEQKKIAVLKVLYSAKEELYLREIAKKSGVAVASVFRILQRLKGVGLVRERKAGVMKYFSLVREGKEKFLEDWFKEENPLEVFVENIRGLSGLKKVWLHGKAEGNRASLILIGEGMDERKVEELSQKARDKGFDLSYVHLTEGQFMRLDKMGIYGGERKELI